MYERLFKVEDPSSEEGDFKDFINEDSLVTIKAYVEPTLPSFDGETRFQFIRNGYYAPDLDSTPEKLIFNKTVGLKEGFKI